MRYRYTPPVDIPVDISGYNHGRTFRDVVEAVQNGVEELGESCSKSEFDFKKLDDVDMSIPTEIYVSKLDVGAEMSTKGNFEDRLADRLGLTKNDPTE